jgi:hypothetical protein
VGKGVALPQAAPGVLEVGQLGLDHQVDASLRRVLERTRMGMLQKAVSGIMTGLRGGLGTDDLRSLGH